MKKKALDLINEQIDSIESSSLHPVYVQVNELVEALDGKRSFRPGDDTTIALHYLNLLSVRAMNEPPSKSEKQATIKSINKGFEKDKRIESLETELGMAQFLLQQISTASDRWMRHGSEIDFAKSINVWAEQYKDFLAGDEDEES